MLYWVMSRISGGLRCSMDAQTRCRLPASIHIGDRGLTPHTCPELLSTVLLYCYFRTVIEKTSATLQ